MIPDFIIAVSEGEYKKNKISFDTRRTPDFAPESSGVIYKFILFFSLFKLFQIPAVENIAECNAQTNCQKHTESQFRNLRKYISR